MTEDKFQGALLGTLVGDALGMAVEGWQPERIRARYGTIQAMHPGHLSAGSYTDDTEMMIGVAESLIRCRGFDPADMVSSWLANCHPHRGYSRATLEVLRLLRSGVSYRQAALQVFQGGSFGNGAAMRVAPVACLYFHSPPRLKLVAREVGRLTHAHPWGWGGAVLQAVAIASALGTSPGQLDKEQFLSALSQSIPAGAEIYQRRLNAAADLLKAGSPPGAGEVIDRLGNGGRATDSVVTAIYAFLRHAGDLEAAVTYAVNLGGDADTIGAMAGAIAGAYHGAQAIPERWWDQLENDGKGRDYIRSLAGQLFDLWQSHGEEGRTGANAPS